MNIVKNTGFGIVLLGLWLLVVATIYSVFFPYEALRRPVTVFRPYTYEYEFRAWHSTDYWIDINVVDKLPSHAGECLLTGSAGANEKCDQIFVPLQLSWELTGLSTESVGGQVFAHRSASSWGKGKEEGTINVARTIGHVNLNTGEKYKLTLKILNDVSALERYQPELIVRTHPGYMKDRSILVTLVQIFSVIVFLFGCGIFFWTQRKSRS